MPYLVVRYHFIVGDCEVPKEVLLSGDGLPEDLVHEYFSDFFEKTVVEEKASLYWSADGSQAVEVDGWTEVPEGDYAVLRKYLGEGV